MGFRSDRRQRLLGCLALLVCGVIALGLLLPLVDLGSDLAQRRMHCLNNMRNLSLALVNYETSFKGYPGYQQTFGMNDSGHAKLGSWVVSLFPQLEQASLRDVWDDPSEQANWELSWRSSNVIQEARFYPRLSSLVCPADVSAGDNRRGPTSYAANTGFYMTADDPASELGPYANVTDASQRSTIMQRSANGVFSNHLPAMAWDPRSSQIVPVFGRAKMISSMDIRDGTSQTIGLAENVQPDLSWQDYSLADDSTRYRVGVVWLYSGTRAAPGRPQPTPLPAAHSFGARPTAAVQPSLEVAYPSSMHPGRFNVARLDGSVLSLSTTIDYRVYQALMTPNTRQSDMPAPYFELTNDYMY